ncbi:rhamnogalacturonan acetylesterase [Neobacillus dielmonensis]|uniref:rhamnogalacturonan acetylesterase n=1 Tax=Neobacillus dielmonensis TaxID=1347369 RepID=UPI0009DF97DF|nr:rhamnogalacturonan acetylesterase [Neobacillus dielmonensis]
MKKRWSQKTTLTVLLIFTACLIWAAGLYTSQSPLHKAYGQQPNGSITIYLAGDSTVSNYSSKLAPREGWGQELAGMFDGKVVVNNQAKPGRSSKSFIDEGRLNTILGQIKEGDYLFIQFGHNDEKIKHPNLYTEPFTTYKSYLKQYIDGARQKGAIPILVTPVERRRFSPSGKVLSSHGQYPAAMRELAKEENVPVIDLTARSKELFQEFGPRETKNLFLWLIPGDSPNYPDGVKDGTHFQKEGAQEIAELVVEEMNKLNLPLTNHVRKEFQ